MIQSLIIRVLYLSYNRFNSNNFKMAIIRFFLRLFSTSESVNEKLFRNMEEWDNSFKKGKVKKGRRFH